MKSALSSGPCTGKKVVRPVRPRIGGGARQAGQLRAGSLDASSEGKSPFRAGVPGRRAGPSVPGSPGRAGDGVTETVVVLDDRALRHHLLRSTGPRTHQKARNSKGRGPGSAGGAGGGQTPAYQPAQRPRARGHFEHRGASRLASLASAVVLPSAPARKTCVRLQRLNAGFRFQEPRIG